jgi:hypothetical protein
LSALNTSVVPKPDIGWRGVSPPPGAIRVGGSLPCRPPPSNEKDSKGDHGEAHHDPWKSIISVWKNLSPFLKQQITPQVEAMMERSTEEKTGALSIE